MPKPINKKCLTCAFLPVEESRLQSCWIEGTCNNKRYYYKERDRKLEHKKINYAIATGKINPETFDLDSTNIYRVEFIMYGKMPDKQQQVNGGVNAIQAVIYEGNNIKFESSPLITQGLLASDIEELIDRNLEQIQQQFGITKVAKFVWKPGFPKDWS